MSNYYLTTTLPYVNSDPHIGFALEIVHADVIARFQRSLGKEVIFNTGTDEHGVKIQRRSQELNVDTQVYVDEYAAKFDRLKDALTLSYTNFIRTTDPKHKAAAQEFWKLCEQNGDIYKKTYQVKYCVGCELEKTDSELTEEGKCVLHPNLEIELINEENYFFRFSKFQQPLLDLYNKYEDFVVPRFRFNEIISFVEQGLQDFSISRLKEKMSWGVPVPGDDTQVMYVWFDALINYISTLGWPVVIPASEPESKFEVFWGSIDHPQAVQFAGKDNLRQQSAMWQAMLLSARLPTSRHIVIHGFITSGGQKMSKSLGNVIDPFAVVEKYGTDALRFWLTYEMSTFEDGDFTIEAFEQVYNSKLASGLGNLVSRVLKMCSSIGHISPMGLISPINPNSEFAQHLEKFEIQKAIQWLWAEYTKLDQFIAKEEPYKVLKVDQSKAKEQLEFLLTRIVELNSYLEIFLPNTAKKISDAVKRISLDAPLFPRITG